MGLWRRLLGWLWRRNVHRAAWYTFGSTQVTGTTVITGWSFGWQPRPRR